MSTEQITLGVYRDLTNRFRGEPDDGPLARSAHEKRKKALEEDLCAPGVKVADWGDTKDQNPHEYVQLVVEFLSSPAVHAAGISALTFVGGVLANACTSIVSDGVKFIFEKLVKRMKNKEIQDFNITTSGGATIIVHSDFKGTIIINGETKSFQADT
jgi:hypothetical protein